MGKQNVVRIGGKPMTPKERLREKVGLLKLAKDEGEKVKTKAAAMRNKHQAVADIEADPINKEIAALRDKLKAIEAKHSAAFAKEIAPVRERGAKLAKLIEKLESQIEALAEVVKETAGAGDDLELVLNDMIGGDPADDYVDADAEAPDDGLTSGVETGDAVEAPESSDDDLDEYLGKV